MLLLGRRTASLPFACNTVVLCREISHILPLPLRQHDFHICPRHRKAYSGRRNHEIQILVFLSIGHSSRPDLIAGILYVYCRLCTLIKLSWLHSSLKHRSSFLQRLCYDCNLIPGPGSGCSRHSHICLRRLKGQCDSSGFIRSNQFILQLRILRIFHLNTFQFQDITGLRRQKRRHRFSRKISLLIKCKNNSCPYAGSRNTALRFSFRLLLRLFISFFVLLFLLFLFFFFFFFRI